ncbi:MAG: SDR family oxidoreductase, partial [Moraxellaceae bacterium]|nr:SDR family oxidoreductase [Moraxellaceae bacterium]
MSQVAIVTGAASGIGACLVQRLLARGYQVCACDINEVNLQRLKVPAQQQSFMTMTLDVRDASGWQQLVEAVMARWQRIDVLANVAGVLKEGWVQDTTEADIDFHFDINVKGVILGMQAVLPTMQAAGRGHIVNIASLASLSPVPGIALYSASKFAVQGFSESIRAEFTRLGIDVLVISPG